ncbi:hypothetical protein QA584_01215 [Anaerocolumna sp. AGMB13025]|uniref:hypothetical protein n=1 Tax=Anaerocolumna sp. AGMB13025 TaxID=3039116 RepID=UPI00241FF4A4|nr:hypothetical protein [Anaerocolumna sp. AGMB13025]WFR57729.1 hypothetical protein QA584_01215 [Anaerocolumna sp. AGMB13025]
MKKIAVLFLSVVMILSFSLTAFGAETTGLNSNTKGAVLESGTVITPNSWYYSYDKTISQSYVFSESIPDSIYYSEYNTGIGAYCSGYLSLQNITLQANGTFKATFKGTIGTYVF